MRKRVAAERRPERRLGMAVKTSNQPALWARLDLPSGATMVTGLHFRPNFDLAGREARVDATRRRPGQVYELSGNPAGNTLVDLAPRICSDIAIWATATGEAGAIAEWVHGEDSFSQRREIF